MQPVNVITINDEKTSDGYHTLIAKIVENGDLILEGVDAGKEVEKFFGDSDFEYWLTMPQGFKETALLYLIKERFSSAHDMKAWLEEKGIPFSFSSY